MVLTYSKQAIAPEVEPDPLALINLHAMRRTFHPFEDLPARWWPRVARPDPDPFEEEERDQILAYFWRKFWNKSRHGYVFVYMLFWTGARPSELTALRWRDVDLRTGMFSITKSRSYGEEGATKTTGSTRTIKLFPGVIDLLRTIKPLRVKPDDYVLLDQRDHPINQWKFGELHFQGALTALKIRHRDFYQTRHTFISVMLSYGENPKEIAEYTGTSLAMISTRYGKFIKPQDRIPFGARALEGAKGPNAVSEKSGEKSEGSKGKSLKNKGEKWCEEGDLNPQSSNGMDMWKTL
jgi:integrase